MDNLKQMSPTDFVKYAAEKHIKFTLPEDNRKYPMQQCQDDLLNQKFRVLHKQIVNAIIQFCKENDIIIDEFHLNADCLEESIKAGSWQSCTDSCLRFDKFTEEYKDAIDMKKIVSDKEFNRIVANEEAFLISM